MRRYRLPEMWRDDAACEATLLALRKVSHFQKNCKQKNAFLYFTKVMQRKVWEQLRMESRLAQGKSPWGKS